ncbi:amino acid adenylation domain-containing protein [Streptomyces sp. NPDC050560]|uniref:amino acid adenylation domain-containing protein n=1 Tax=Streptomyces sp. NPDC050560 TaxID=3365630 RepID=UPI0037BB257D
MDAWSELSAAVGELLGLPAEGIDEDAHLVGLGLDSLAMMRLAGRCRRAGSDVRFADLMAEPTLGAWRRLLRERAAEGTPTAAPHALVDESAPFDLALMQHAYWVGRSEGQRLGGVAAHFYNEFDGHDVDPGRLERAVRAVLARHGMLRVAVLDDGRQRILAESPWPGLRVHDLRDLPGGVAQQRLAELRGNLSHRRMDIAAAEVLDVQLSLLAGGATRLHVNLDMVAADALSLRVLLADLARAYAEPATAPPALGYSFPRYLADRAAHRRAPAHAQALEADRAYWQRRLPGLPSAPRLPTRGHGPEAVTVVRRHLHLDAERARCLGDHAHRHGLTTAMAMTAVFAEVLQGFSAEPDLLLNLPLFDREPLHDDVAHLVGDFTSSVLLAWHGGEPGTFAERAARLQQRFHEDAAHCGYSGVEVLRDASRLHGERVLAPVVHTSALGLGELFADSVTEHFGRPSWIISQGPQVWLDAQITEVDGGLLANWDAREDAFEPGVLDAMFGAYRDLVERLLTDQDAWQRPVPPLLPASRRAVRDKADDTDRQPLPACLHDAFFARAAAAPGAPALAGDGTALSYGQLADAALTLAAHLRGRGVTAGDLVAISLPKGPDQIVAVLAVLAAGAAYAPVGVDQPHARRERILASATARLVLDDISVPEGTEPLPAPVPGDPAGLAYVIHTSGSTGEPKGVEITHAAAFNTVTDLNDRFSVAPSDRTLAVSALDFDLSVYDIFGTLSAGGTLVCVDEDARRDAAAWDGLVTTHGVTLVNCAPALLDMLVTAAGPGCLGTLRLVLLGGDRIPLDLPGRVRAAAPDCRFVALGGTTETAIHSTVQEVTAVPDSWTSVPYGRPLRGVRCRVVDVLGRDCPDWVPGELWIGGAGVARGYRGDGVRTAERFVVVDGVRWYRTGDLGRYWPDGTLEFLGRADHQVKIRGHRVELGEVEAALLTAPEVRAAVALVGEDGRLAAAVVGAAEPAVVRAHTAERLPSVMVPEDIAVLDELPLTPNGKTDRKALVCLVAQSAAPHAAATTPPRTAEERRLARAWEDILATSGIGREDDFFARGGDSLLATRLIARLRTEGGDTLRLSDLFAHPVLADLARHVTTDGETRPAPTVTTDPEHRHTPFPLTDVQRAYWLGRGEDFTLGGVGCHFYREYEIEDLDPGRLETALNRLIRRHEMLRVIVDGDGRQRILPEVPRLSVGIADAGPDPEAGFRALRESASHQVFDPGTWPLFAVRGVRAGRLTRLGIGIDNIALDALSILIFSTELSLLYADPEAVLPPVDVTFRDYLASVGTDPDAVAAAREYWTGLVPGLPPAPALPLAKDPATVVRPHFTRREARIEAHRWKALAERARDHGLTPSGVLLAAFADTLSRWSARRDLTLNLTLFDRRDIHPHIGRVLGDFTSLMLVPFRPEARETWLERARRLQEELWRSLDHREVSAVQVLRELARSTGDPETIMPVVFTSALGVGGEPPLAPFDRQVWGVSQTPQVWLDHQVTEDGDGVCLNWDAVDELFPEGLLDTAFDAYLGLVDWLSGHDWTQPAPDLLPAAQRTTRATANATGTAHPALLHGAFFRHAARHPHRTALLWGEEGRMTYGDLATRALKLSGALVEHGVRPGQLVAVTLPKGPDQIVAVLAVLAAGAAYVPVGPDQPPARGARIHRLAGTRLALTAPGGPSAAGVPTLTVDAAPVLDVPAAPVQVPPDTLAYTIFTSGSTGAPKGVEITHAAASNTVTDVNERFGVGTSDRALAVSALDFDLSVYDVFGPLSAGGTVVLIEEEMRRDAHAWLDLVRRHRVTVWNTVPTLLDMLVTTAESTRAPDSLRLALISGDWIGLDLPGRLAQQNPWCRFIALGGATEAAIWSNAHEVTAVDPAWRSVPYGRPLRGQSFRVVDALGRDCPDWVPGELWIGGAGVARGYRGDPERTAERFVVAGGVRWYRTGDLGRYWPDGTLEFLGRADHQVKVRGHRVELGEIETALRAAPGVGRAVAAVAGDRAARRLVAAVVPAGGHAPAALRTAQPDAATRRFRDLARAREAAVARSFLLRLLDPPGDGSPLTAARWAARLGVTDAHLPTLRLWLRWLADDGALLRGGAGYTPAPGAAPAPPGPAPGGDGYAALLQRAYDRLLDRLDDYRDILTGRADPALLLADPVLAPARLAAADPGGDTALAAVAAHVTEAATALGRPVEIAELGGGDGTRAARMLSRLAPEQVHYTLTDADPGLVESAERCLGGLAHRTDCRRLVGPVIPDDLQHRFDLVLADQTLHRGPDPSHGTALAGLLVRGGGKLLAVERSELTPVALLTAALLDGGYADFDRERRAAGTPVLPAARWAELLGAAGFDSVDHTPVPGSFLELLVAERPARATALDPGVLRDLAAAQLPAHMVPERVAVLPRLPLGANGKLDRPALATLLANDGPADTDEPPSGELEQRLASLWGELLGTRVVGRRQSFFALGGDSLLAARFLAEVTRTFGVELPLRRMFAGPTLQQLARALGDLLPTQGETEEGTL